MCIRDSRCGIDYIITDPLNLRGQTKEQFFAFLREQFPQQYLPLVRLYQNGHLSRTYRQQMRTHIQALYRKYGVSASYRWQPPKSEMAQLLSLIHI